MHPTPAHTAPRPMYQPSPRLTCDLLLSAPKPTPRIRRVAGMAMAMLVVLAGSSMVGLVGGGAAAWLASQPELEAAALP